MSEIIKPKIEEIIFLSGEILNDVQIEIDAPTIPGFMAIVSQDLSKATAYIALGSIQSITMKNEEICRFLPTNWISPEATIRVRN